MPEITRFYGIVIKMYFLQSEHNPPHIHVFYNGDVAAVDYLTGEVLTGEIPPKALALVNEWTAVNREALNRMWKTQEFEKLPPLE